MQGSQKEILSIYRSHQIGVTRVHDADIQMRNYRSIDGTEMIFSPNNHTSMAISPIPMGLDHVRSLLLWAEVSCKR
jgi:hypothetical protein